MSYKAVGFDYGGVIGGLDASFSSFIEDLAKIMGISVDEITQQYFALNRKINCGEIRTWREFWQLFLGQFNRLDLVQEVDVMTTQFAKHLNIIDQRMLDLVDSLKSSGLKVGLLSNTSLERGKELRDLKVNTHFDVFLVSAEIRMMKPDGEAFMRLASELGVSPKEMVFIDDSQGSLSAADQCGFTPILFKDYTQLVSDLQQLKII
jgi:putative hydrolase of the HAD superfamily